MKPTFRDAHDATDYALANVSGIAEALRELSWENSYLGSNDKDAMMLMSLIVTISDQLKQVTDLHSVEWAASRDGGEKAA